MSNDLFADLLGKNRRHAVDDEEFEGADGLVVVMAVDRDKLVFIEDGAKSDLKPMLSILTDTLNTNLVVADVPPNCDLDLMRRSTKALNEEFGHLIRG